MTRVHLLAACICLVALAAPASASHPIQPGGYVETGPPNDISACTLNFVFDGTGVLAGNTYIGTAAHCVIHEDRYGNEYVASEARDFHGTAFGTVAFHGEDDDPTRKRDYAFIRVAPGALSRVRAGVAGNERWPQGGVTSSSDTKTGDRVQISGWGLAFSFHSLTRENRQGFLTSYDAERWRAAGAWDFGDSGGPLVHIDSGKALGIEASLCIDVCTDMGPTVEGILAKAAAAGFTVKLRSAS